MGLLKRGEVDAICWPGGGGFYAFHPGGPIDLFCRQHGWIRSLIDDSQAILDYYRRTRLDHITVTVAIKSSTVEREPDVPALLLQLFHKAADAAKARMGQQERKLLEKEVEILDRDPFDYRFGPVELNSMSTLARYQYEQKLVPHVPQLGELVPNSLLEGCADGDVPDPC